VESSSDRQMTSASPSLLWTLVAQVFWSHGGEREQGEELPSVHGSIKYAKDDAMG
jgi:hypothetical protein